MAENKQVWAVSTPGAPHDASLARKDVYASTGGVTGLIAEGGGGVGLTPGVPMSVRLEPCAVVAKSTYAGARRESYSFDVESSVDVPIEVTGSGGGRTDVIALIVSDPILEGKKVAELDANGELVVGSEGLDPRDYDYWDTHVFKAVPVSARRSPEAFRQWANQQNVVPGPVIPYAIVTQGADSTGLEGKVQPFFESVMGRRESIPPIVTDLTGHSVERGPTNGEYWTLGPQVLIEVPDFATHVTLTLEVSGLYVKHSTSSTRQGSSGYLRARFLDQNTPQTRWDMDINEGRVTRGTYTVARRFVVPEAMRGTVQPVQLMVTNEYSGTAVGVNSGSTFITNATFEEIL